MAVGSLVRVRHSRMLLAGIQAKSLAADLHQMARLNWTPQSRLERYRRYAMKAKIQRKSRILKAVHETAKDLHEAGFITKRRMREYDALCLTPVPRYSRNKIRALRERHRISQSGPGDCAKHQPFNHSSVGDWRQTPKWSIPQAA
jgi:DNA-binding transcriptional regulator YiaG